MRYSIDWQEYSFPLPHVQQSSQLPFLYPSNYSQSDSKEKQISIHQGNQLKFKNQFNENEREESQKSQFIVPYSQNVVSTSQGSLMKTDMQKKKYVQNGEAKPKINVKLFQLFSQMLNIQKQFAQKPEQKTENQKQQYLRRYKEFISNNPILKKKSLRSQQTRNITNQFKDFIIHWIKFKWNSQQDTEQLLSNPDCIQFGNKSSQPNLLRLYRNKKFHKCLRGYFLSKQLARDLQKSSIRKDQKKQYRPKWKYFKILFDQIIINPTTNEYVIFDNLSVAESQTEPNQKRRYRTRATFNLPPPEKSIDRIISAEDSISSYNNIRTSRYNKL